MVDIKQNKMSCNLNTSVKCGNNIEDLHNEHTIMENTIIIEQEKKKLEQRLNKLSLIGLRQGPKDGTRDG